MDNTANQSQITSAAQGPQTQTPAAQEPQSQQPAAPAAEGAAAPEAGQQQEPAVYEVKHNKEAVKLTRDELLQAASKGLDYDRIRGAYDFVKEKAGGADVQEYIAKARQEPATLTKEETDQLHQEADALYQKYVGEGATDAMARDFANSQIEQKSRQLIDSRQQQAQTARHQQASLFDRIVRENPDYMQNGQVSIPQDVLDGMADLQRAGLASNPYAAHMLYKAIHQTDALKQEVESLKAGKAAAAGNAANAQSTTGSVASGPAAAPKDFYTSDEWDNLDAATKHALVKSGTAFKMMARWKK